MFHDYVSLQECSHLSSIMAGKSFRQITGVASSYSSKKSDFATDICCSGEAVRSIRLQIVVDADLRREPRRPSTFGIYK